MRNMVYIGSSAQPEIEDSALSRYASYALQHILFPNSLIFLKAVTH